MIKWIWVPAITVAVLFGTGCATGPKVPGVKQPAVFATHEDLVHLAYWESLVAEENGNDRSREMINHTRMPDSQAHLAVMRGEKAVWTEKQREWARSYVKEATAGILKSRTWPVPPAYTIRRAQGVLALDGKGDDAVWAKAEPIPVCYPYAQTNAITRPPATCRLLWDEKNLYLLFDVADTNILSTCTNRDDAVSQGDCVEIFLLPSKRFGQYWEFNFSPAGVVFDALAAKSWKLWGGDYRVEENAAVTLATSVHGTLNREADRDQGYRVEASIPWSELPGFQHGAAAGDTLWAMIGWADKATLATPGNPAYFSHTPFLAWFHNIWGYSRLTLE
jgi:hypothetical protein